MDENGMRWSSRVSWIAGLVAACLSAAGATAAVAASSATLTIVPTPVADWPDCGFPHANFKRQPCVTVTATAPRSYFLAVFVGYKRCARDSVTEAKSAIYTLAGGRPLTGQTIEQAQSGEPVKRAGYFCVYIQPHQNSQLIPTGKVLAHASRRFPKP